MIRYYFSCRWFRNVLFLFYKCQEAHGTVALLVYYLLSFARHLTSDRWSRLPNAYTVLKNRIFDVLNAFGSSCIKLAAYLTSGRIFWGDIAITCLSVRSETHPWAKNYFQALRHILIIFIKCRKGRKSVFKCFQNASCANQNSLIISDIQKMVWIKIRLGICYAYRIHDSGNLHVPIVTSSYFA